MPTWIRSSISTLAGSLAIIWCASRRTSPLYCFSVEFRSSWPLAVYMVAPEIMGSATDANGAALRPSCEAKSPSRQRRCAKRAATRRQQVAGPAARTGRRPDRRAPSRAARRRRSGRRTTPAWRRCARRAASCGAAPSSRSMTTRPARCGEQLHRRVGVGDARRPVLGEHDRARRSAPRAVAGVAARTCGRARSRSRGPRRRRSRRRFRDALEEGARRAARIDEADRQAARGEVGELRRQRARRTGARSTSAISPALAGASRRHRRRASCAPRSANAVQSRSSSDAAVRDVRVGDDRHDAHAGARRTCGAGRRPGRWREVDRVMACCVGEAVERRSARSSARCRGAMLAAGGAREDQVHLAAHRCARPRCRRRAARAARARWPTGDASPRARAGRWRRRRRQLVADRGVERRGRA